MAQLRNQWSEHVLFYISIEENHTVSQFCKWGCAGFAWQIKWSWSERRWPGRRPWSTVDSTTVTWCPSLTITSRNGSKREWKTPTPTTCGWDWATPALWTSGSGSVTNTSPTRTGPHRKGEMTVTSLQPWEKKSNISGWWSQMMRSLISSVQNSVNPPDLTGDRPFISCVQDELKRKKIMTWIVDKYNITISNCRVNNEGKMATLKSNVFLPSRTKSVTCAKLSSLLLPRKKKPNIFDALFWFFS